MIPVRFAVGPKDGPYFGRGLPEIAFVREVGIGTARKGFFRNLADRRSHKRMVRLKPGRTLARRPPNERAVTDVVQHGRTAVREKSSARRKEKPERKKNAPNAMARGRSDRRANKMRHLLIQTI